MGNSILPTTVWVFICICLDFANTLPSLLQNMCVQTNFAHQHIGNNIIQMSPIPRRLNLDGRASKLKQFWMRARTLISHYTTLTDCLCLTVFFLRVFFPPLICTPHASAGCSCCARGSWSTTTSRTARRTTNRRWSDTTRKWSGHPRTRSAARWPNARTADRAASRSTTTCATTVRREYNTNMHYTWLRIFIPIYAHWNILSKHK